MVEMHTPEQLMECAYHEAGHAVASIRLGFKVHGMSLIPERKYGAIVIWENPLETLKIGMHPNPYTIGMAEKAVTVFLAGPIAASWYKEEPFDRIGDEQQTSTTPFLGWHNFGCWAFF